jgi:hypothetical protein
VVRVVTTQIDERNRATRRRVTSGASR